MVGQVDKEVVFLDHQPLGARRHRALLRVELLLQGVDEGLQALALLASLAHLIGQI